MPQSSGLNGHTPELKHIPLAFDTSDPLISAKNLLFALKPEWRISPGDVEFVRFKEGITNNLFKAIKKRPDYSEQQIDGEAVMLRAYGNGTAILIDREREAQSHSLLAKHNLAPTLLARFENGLLYCYIEGIACNPEDMRGPRIWPATARLLGQWHATLPVNGNHDSSILNDSAYTPIISLLPDVPTPNIWTVMQRWILALPVISKPERERRQILQAELEYSTKLLGRTQGLANTEYTMSHCDLLSGNIIILPPANTGAGAETTDVTVSFIDYEYATPSPAAFDLANHFAEWGGFACDYNVLPTRRQRLAFIREYVRSYRAHKHSSSSSSSSAPPSHASSASTNGTSITTTAISTDNGASWDEEADTSQLAAEVDACRGLPGLYWGIWALIQAQISQIDFDYAAYAEVRLAEYWDWKAEEDGSREREGRKMPLRERRLAED